MDRFDAMRAFVNVAELRGFAPAARRLGMSPSAITRSVAALEELLGIRLLQRTTRSVTLTDAGTRYLERARRILSALEEAEGAAQAERLEPSGRFVVSAPNVFGRLQVAPALCAFLAQHPAVTGELLLADRPVNLVEEGIDLAVRIGRLADASLVARKVGATRRVVVGSPKYLAARKAPRTPAALEKHDLIQFSALTPTPSWHFGPGEQDIVHFTPRFVTNSADAAIGHAQLGGGLTMVLAYQVADALRAGRLEIVLAKFEPPPLPIQLVYTTRRHLSANVRAFTQVVETTCEWDFVDL